jgi:ABC-2 type transport system permease protein
MIEWARVGEIVRKEFRQSLREPRMRVVLFVPPLVQLLLFGYAVNLDVENARIAWIDQDHTPASRELRAAFEGSGRFRVVAEPEREADAARLLDGGSAQAVVHILPGFARDVARGRPAAAQVLVEGTNSNTASIVSSYASRIIGTFGVATVAGGLDVRSRVWFNAELRSRNYFVPGVVVNIVALVTLMLTAMAIVREKEIGTVEQLMVTPIRPLELMIGKTAPFALVGLVEVVFVTSMALLVFRIPFRGSAALLLTSAVLFLLTTAGAGLFISTVSQTQQQAMMSSFFFFMPAFLLSGFAFPIRNMPEGVQYLTYLDPMRYFITIVRGIFLKGTGVDVLWPQMAALLGLGVAVVVLSAQRFRKRLD